VCGQWRPDAAKCDCLWMSRGGGRKAVNVDRRRNLLSRPTTLGTSQASAVGRLAAIGLSQFRAFGRDTNRPARLKILGKLIATGQFHA
jgi:hypothetical protein